MNALFRPLAAASLGLLTVLCTSNCAVVLIGAAVGTAVYLEGELESALATDIRSAVEATNKAASQVGLKPVSRTGDTTEALMIATDYEGRKVRIKLMPDELNSRITMVKIRVGVGGNEEESRRILKAIERNL